MIDFHRVAIAAAGEAHYDTTQKRADAVREALDYEITRLVEDPSASSLALDDEDDRQRLIDILIGAQCEECGSVVDIGNLNADLLCENCEPSSPEEIAEAVRRFQAACGTDDYEDAHAALERLNM